MYQDNDTGDVFSLYVHLRHRRRRTYLIIHLARQAAAMMVGESGKSLSLSVQTDRKDFQPAGEASLFPNAIRHWRDRSTLETMPGLSAKKGR